MNELDSTLTPVSWERLIEFLDNLEAGRSVTFAARTEREDDALLFKTGVSGADRNLYSMTCQRRGRYRDLMRVRFLSDIEPDGRGRFVYRWLKRMARHSGLRIDRFSKYGLDSESLRREGDEDSHV